MTPTELQTLKAAILADPVLNAFPNTADGAFDLAAVLNAPAVPQYDVWNSRAPVQAVFDAISWSAYTPTDTPDGTAVFTNRLLAIQTKQMNLQNILVGRDTIDGTKVNVRSGLRDAVVALPSGAGGASTSAGGASGVNVLTQLTRPAKLIEKILATGTATTGTVTAGLIGREGTVSYQDVQAARAA